TCYSQRPKRLKSWPSAFVRNFCSLPKSHWHSSGSPTSACSRPRTMRWAVAEERQANAGGGGDCKLKIVKCKLQIEGSECEGRGLTQRIWLRAVNIAALPMRLC